MGRGADDNDNIVQRKRQSGVSSAGNNVDDLKKEQDSNDVQFVPYYPSSGPQLIVDLSKNGQKDTLGAEEHNPYSLDVLSRSDRKPEPAEKRWKDFKDRVEESAIYAGIASWAMFSAAGLGWAVAPSVFTPEVFWTVAAGSAISASAWIGAWYTLTRTRVAKWLERRMKAKTKKEASPAAP